MVVRLLSFMLYMIIVFLINTLSSVGKIDLIATLRVQSVFNGMHVVFVSYALMKVDPASWLKMVTRFKGE